MPLIASLILASIPALSLFGVSSVFILLAVASLLFLGQKREIIPLAKTDYFFVLVLCFPLVAAIITMLVNHNWEWSYVDKYIRYPMGALAFVLMLKGARIKLDLSLLKLGFYVAALIGFSYALYQKIILEQELASAGIFSISFGEIMTAIAVISLLRFEQNRVNAPLWRILSFSLATLATIMAGTKGAWVAYPFLLWFVFDLYFGKHLWKQLAIFLGAILMIGVIMWIIPFSKNRIKSAVSDVTGYYAKDSFTPTSQGLRLMMWDTALEIYQDNPIFGVGPADVSSELISRCETSSNESISATIDKYKSCLSHVHNDWLESLAGQGILGSLSFALFIFFPLIFSFKQRHNSCEKIKVMAYFNIIINVGFSIFCLTQCLHMAPRDFWIAFNMFSFVQLRLPALATV